MMVALVSVGSAMGGGAIDGPAGVLAVMLTVWVRWRQCCGL